MTLDPTTTKLTGQSSDTSDDGRFQRVGGQGDSDAVVSERYIIFEESGTTKWLEKMK